MCGSGQFLLRPMTPDPQATSEWTHFCKISLSLLRTFTCGHTNLFSVTGVLQEVVKKSLTIFQNKVMSALTL